MIDERILLGFPIDFKDICQIYPPTVNDVVGNKDFGIYQSLFTMTQEQIQDEIFEKLVKIVPRVGPKETAHSIIAVRIARARGLASNNEFKNVNISVEVFVPMTQWIIKDTNLRPFAIMGEVQKSLNGKKIEGLGKLTGGDFSLNLLTEEISAYEQTFVLTSYD